MLRIASGLPDTRSYLRFKMSSNCCFDQSSPTYDALMPGQLRLETRALSTLIRFHLKTQLFVYGPCFRRPRVSDENDHSKRNFSKTLSRVELFENAVFACTCGRTKTELFENADVTLSVPIHSAQYYELIQDGGQALHFLVFNTWAYFKPNCLFFKQI